MIKEELQMDNYYIPESQIILVRINHKTMENPVLKDWWKYFN